MRLTSAHIRGYRCIKDETVDFLDLTALVGSGGVGKSTVLNALDWFFHGGDLEERDLHLESDGETRAQEVLVAVTFSDLSDADRKILGAYVEGQTTTLTRTWSEADGQKLSGNALVFPEFQHVRDAEGATELKRRYRELFEDKGEALGLPEPSNKREDVERGMEVWEREHATECEPQTKDARHLFGATGTPVLQDRFEYVLVSASVGAPEALGAERNTVLDRLLSVIEELSVETREEIAGVQEDAQAVIHTLISAVRGQDLLSLSGRLSTRAAEYFPGAAIRLKDEVTPPRPPAISVRALISDHGGHPIAPDLQGHGLQRALVIALLHELAEAGQPGGETDSPRNLMLAIEEPELYQHPLQARHLSASLNSLAHTGGSRIQVAYSTHSPYFSGPALFADIRLCRREAGEMTCVAADPAGIEKAVADVGYQTDAGERAKRALAVNLREAIFARAVLLCEGPGDAAVLEGVGDVQGGLDRDGVAVANCGGKSSLIIAVAILRQLEIPYFVLFDADAAKESQTEADLNKELLAICGETGEEWPSRGVRARSANFKDMLESDLGEIWPAFDEAREAVAKELGVGASEKEPRVYREAVPRAGEPHAFLVEILDKARSLAAA